MVATYLWTQRACGTSTIGKDKCGEIGEHATMPLNRLQGTLRCSPTASEEHAVIFRELRWNLLRIRVSRNQQPVDNLARIQLQALHTLNLAPSKFDTYLYT